MWALVCVQRLGIATGSFRSRVSHVTSMLALSAVSGSSGVTTRHANSSDGGATPRCDSRQPFSQRAPIGGHRWAPIVIGASVVAAGAAHSPSPCAPVLCWTRSWRSASVSSGGLPLFCWRGGRWRARARCPPVRAAFLGRLSVFGSGLRPGRLAAFGPWLLALTPAQLPPQDAMVSRPTLGISSSSSNEYLVAGSPAPRLGAGTIRGSTSVSRQQFFKAVRRDRPDITPAHPLVSGKVRACEQ